MSSLLLDGVHAQPDDTPGTASPGTRDRDSVAMLPVLIQRGNAQDKTYTVLGRFNGGLRIVVHHRGPLDVVSDALSRLFSSLGAEQVEQRAINQSTDVHQVRYFYDVDRQQAQALAGVLQGILEDTVTVHDFSFYTPLPSQGSIEVWMQ